MTSRKKPPAKPKDPPIVDLEDALGAAGVTGGPGPLAPALAGASFSAADDGPLVKHMMAPGQIPHGRQPSGPLNVRRYVNRIQIVEAWQYRGTLRDAPDFVDRSWAAWDDAPGGVPGPALRVPGERDEPKLCRGGDYVVRQQVTLVEGLLPDERVEVWQREEFERLFMPSNRPGQPTDEGGELDPVPRQVPPIMEDA